MRQAGTLPRHIDAVSPKGYTHDLKQAPCQSCARAIIIPMAQELLAEGNERGRESSTILANGWIGAVTRVGIKLATRARIIFLILC